ncbi:methyltransferase [Nonomuraea sp. NPDC059007]|uniref:methyltransferase n=1 Tax=Nonomuraea sp. NPDC059007 TaxID=3346692 RepID=UPI003694A8CB
MNRLTTSRGELELTRHPEDPRDPLRAWDAADAYLLRHLGEPSDPGQVVIAFDRWGALATALAAYRPTQISDSHLAQEATRANLKRNGVDADAVRLLSTQDDPPPHVGTLLVRVPKSLAVLEDQLHRLAPSLRPGAVVVGAGMVKEIHTSTLRLFETIIGPTRTSLAEQKARLIFSTPSSPAGGGNPWPLTYALPDGIGPASGRTVVNHAGVFCADRLDVGTRFFLAHLPRTTGPVTIADLGCGNGVVGMSAALDNPEATIVYADESHQAIASARVNAPQGAARFLLADGLTGVDPGSVDLVLNNPPFHTHQAVGDATAWRMFTGARRALRTGGELWVIGNRHLGYHVKLRRIFGNCDVMASDPKFVVLRARKGRPSHSTP